MVSLRCRMQEGVEVTVQVEVWGITKWFLMGDTEIRKAVVIVIESRPDGACSPCYCPVVCLTFHRPDTLYLD